MPNDSTLLLLNGRLICELLRPEDAMAAVRDAFLLHASHEGKLFPVIREPLPHGVFGIKSAMVTSQNLLGLKAAGFWPRNHETSREAHQATIMLVDARSGVALCVLDGNPITTLRTGAAGALGIRHLARPNAQTVCLFGTGVQARIQLETTLLVCPSIKQVLYLTASGLPNPQFEARFADRCPLRHSPDPDQAISISDIIITATPGHGPLFSADAIRPGTHINCVGADTRGKRELPDGLLARSRVFVDDLDQARNLGELQWAPEISPLVFGHHLADARYFIRQPEDITIFDMTGLALQDLTVAQWLYARASQLGLGQAVAWS